MPVEVLSIRNDAIVKYTDVSDLTIIRNGRKSNLKQNHESKYSKELNELKSVNTFESVNDYVDKYNNLYNLHATEMTKKTGSLFKSLGTLSNNQTKSLRKCVQSSINYNIFNNQNTYVNIYRNVFITLTLPSSQLHSDTVIRRCLSKFLYNICRLYDVEKYVWKAETQHNGNIHFHVLADRFIPWGDIRRLWNNSLKHLGYVDRYAEMRKRIGFVYKKMQNSYKTGVKKIIPHLKSREQQFNDYLKEKREGFLNPNSTDIHDLLDVKCIASYILKYMTKLEYDKRPVIGSMWGASNRLKKLDYPTFYDGTQEYDQLLPYLNSTEKELKKIKLDNEYVSIYVGKVYSVLKKKFSFTWSKVKYYYSVLSDQYYDISIDLNSTFSELKKDLIVPIVAPPPKQFSLFGAYL